jgi:transposase
MPHVSPLPPAAAKPVLGIDVSGKRLDLAFSDGQIPDAIDYDAAGLGKLLQLLHDKPVTLVVVESTGGIEQTLIDTLLDAGIEVSRVPPGRVRNFARADAQLAKTDTIDAMVLARFGERLAPRTLEKRCKTRAELDALVTCRRQLVAVRAEQANRRRNVTSKTALSSIDAVQTSIQKQIDKLDAAIRKLIDSDDDLSGTDRILRSVPGVGIGLSSALLGAMSELGTLHKNRAAALIGVAPFNSDSGQRKGTRHIRGGRMDIRNTLYMSAVSAVQHNPVIKVFADRLTKAGKPFKVMITACMRKLATLLNAMVRDRVQWDQLNVVKSLKTA